MAKLASVMVVGENIEVDGVTYERTDEDVGAGDIVQCFKTCVCGDLTRGAFYTVEGINSDGDIVIKDDAGDERYRSQSDSYFVHFRKVGADQFKVGDLVEIVDASKSRWHVLKDGDVGEVTHLNVEEHPATPYRVEIDYDFDYFPAEALRKVEKPALKVGDYAKVVDTDGNPFNYGDIVEIYEHDRTDIPYNVRRVTDGERSWMYKGQLVPAMPEEVAAAKEAKRPKLKVGDYVRVITDDEELPKGTIGRIMAIYRTGGYNIIVETIDGSDYDWYRTDQIEKVDEQTAKWAAIGRKVGEIKKGDIVRILRDHPCGSRHKKGDIGTVGELDEFDFEVITAREGDTGCWVISDSVELVAPVESVVNLRGADA